MAKATRLLSLLSTRLAVLATVWLLMVGLVFFTTGTQGGPRIIGPGTRPVVMPRIDPAKEYTRYITSLLKGQLVHIRPDQDLGAELRKMAGPSLNLLGLSLLVGAGLGTLSAMAVRFGRQRLKLPWEAGVFSGLVLPESVVTALLWMGAYWVFLEFNYVPFPRLWVLDIGWRHYVLPVAALSVFPAAYLGRSVATAMDELDSKLFLRVARSKGLSEGQLLTSHKLKHIGYRLCSVLPSLIAWLLSALIVVEWIFLIPGLGRQVGQMLWQRHVDPYRLATYVTVFMALIGLVHLTCGILARMLDPRSDDDER